MVDDAGGWYPDPEGPQGRERWWDGRAWTERTRGIGGNTDSAAPPPPSVSIYGPVYGETGPSDVIGGYDRPRRNWTPVLVGAGLVAVLVLLVGLVLAGGGDKTPTADPSGTTSDPPSSSAAPECATSTTTPAPSGGSQGPVPAGPRVTDPDAKLSYAKQGAPFIDWPNRTMETAGAGAVFSTGYYFVTQPDSPDGEYWATVLSGTLPAQFADAPVRDVRCTALQVGEDVRQQFYPEPTEEDSVVQRAMTVSGRPAYFLQYHLSFDQEGYTAKGELVALLVVDTGSPNLGVLWISIPDTHKQYDKIVAPVIASVRIA